MVCFVSIFSYKGLEIISVANIKTYKMNVGNRIK